MSWELESNETSLRPTSFLLTKQMLTQTFSVSPLLLRPWNATCSVYKGRLCYFSWSKRQGRWLMVLGAILGCEMSLPVPDEFWFECLTSRWRINFGIYVFIVVIAHTSLVLLLKSHAERSPIVHQSGSLGGVQCGFVLGATVWNPCWSWMLNRPTSNND